MDLSYSGKKNEKEIYSNIKTCELESSGEASECMSKLIKGDNLEVMKYLIEKMDLEGKIDLIYIDPPFSTKNTFRIGKDRANSISKSNCDNIAYEDSLVGPEYIEFIRERLILLKMLMSRKASIYFHIDYKIGHYIKIIMDEIFGKDNFINDITRIKCNPKNFKRKAFGNIKDMILLYSNTSEYIWNEPRELFTEEDISKLFKKIDKNGRKYTTIPLHAPGETEKGPTGQTWRGVPPPKGRHWRCAPEELEKLDNKGLVEWSKNGVPRKIIYADEKKCKKMQDIIEFKDTQKPLYPTEKNLDLLKLIIKTSSDENSYVLDCFCGSGTTLKAAQETGRNWIGIDQSGEAIKVALNKLDNKQGYLDRRGDYEYLELTHRITHKVDDKQIVIGV